MKSRPWRRVMCRATGMALAIAVGGCGNSDLPLSTMAPKSDFANWILAVYLEVIGWDTLVLIVVSAALGLALFRFSTRATGKREPPKRAVEHLALEAAWTAGPAGILLFIAIPSILITFRSQPAAPPPNALLVKVVAHQWWWEFQYPALGITTANEMHLPVGQPVRLELESADVIHSFWVPKLGGKRDVVPGHTNELTLTPNAEGYYYGECAEFCGLSHANMQFRVMVEPLDRFNDWKVHEASGAAMPVHDASSGDPVAVGATIYSNSPCTTCHTIAGVSSGRLAPNLTHFGSRTTLAAGTLENNPRNLAAWVRNPKKLKPGAQMPALGLSAQQASQLAAYLESLK